jgi:hypothetical protein
MPMASLNCVVVDGQSWLSVNTELKNQLAT